MGLRFGNEEFGKEFLPKILELELFVLDSQRCWMDLRLPDEFVLLLLLLPLLRLFVEDVLALPFRSLRDVGVVAIDLELPFMSLSLLLAFLVVFEKLRLAFDLYVLLLLLLLVSEPDECPFASLLPVDQRFDDLLFCVPDVGVVALSLSFDLFLILKFKLVIISVGFAFFENFALKLL